MNTKRFSRNSFSVMLGESAKKIAFIPILTFIILLGNTLSYYTYVLKIKAENSNIRLYFWNDLNYSSSFFCGLVLGLAGIISGITLFNFAVNKKRSNMIFSLGIGRRKIFAARYLAGVLPFAVAVLLAGFFELVSCFCNGGAPTVPLLSTAAYKILAMIGIYTLSFTITSAALAFSGNIVEGGIFTAIIGAFPVLSKSFFESMRDVFTHGSSIVSNSSWNLFNTYFYLCDFEIENSGYEYLNNLSEGSVISKLELADWSGVIMDFVYAGIIFALCILFFANKKNEICGTFGRAKGMTEICAVICGIYAIEITLMGLPIDCLSHGNGNLNSYFIILFSFVLTYFVFKMIFGYKRKLMIKRMLKTIPAYAVSVAIITVIFSTGLFGYSSRIPDAEDVDSISFSFDTESLYSAFTEPNALHRMSMYGYASMQRNDNYSSPSLVGRILDKYISSLSNYTLYSVDDSESISKIIKVHERFVHDGKIKDTSSDSCGINFEITYTLKNGKKIVRYYSETTQKNAMNILLLNNLPCVKSTIYNIFKEVDASEEQSANKCLLIGSKSLKNLCYGGELTSEFKTAVISDLEKQSAAQLFFHKPEDELGIIRIEIEDEYGTLDENEYTDADGNIYEYDSQTEKIIQKGNIDARDRKLGQKIDSCVSLTWNGAFSIIVTKDMTNTVKYLTDKGLIKYFKSDISADDVKCIKLATKSETLNTVNSHMLPMFAAGYSNAEENEYNDTVNKDFSYHYFKDNVNNEITNKNTIQKILDNSFIYGYCGNDYRIAEVTFNDGSIATYCISGDVYEKLMK